jgi:Na+/H+ antiporter NhaC
MIIKTDYRFFIAIIILLAVLYLRMLKKYELIAMLDDEDIKDPTIDTMIYINNIIFISVIVLTIIGFFIYMGKKKYEYKNKFSYINFLFGIYKCT